LLLFGGLLSVVFGFYSLNGIMTELQPKVKPPYGTFSGVIPCGTRHSSVKMGGVNMGQPGGGVDNIGQRLKEERQLRGWSQRDLARETGVNTDTISGIETGQHEPRPSTLRKLAEGLGVEVRDLFLEPSLPKAPAREAGQPERKRPIFNVVREAVIKQAEQDRQAVNRDVESELLQVYWKRHENEVMPLLLEYKPDEVAKDYFNLVKAYMRLKQEHTQLARRVEVLERQLEEVST
jgi:transcriptional regulator with XRE-family HTH domain